jgi:hypothetical protein
MKLLFKSSQGFVLLALSIFVLAGCGPRYKDQPDCGFVQNVYGERISWKDVGAIGLHIHESFPAEMRPALNKAMDQWSQAIGRPAFRIIQTNYQSKGPAQDGVNVVYWLKTWEAEKFTEQARTTIYWVGDRIREADIRINDKNFDFYLETPSKYEDVHLESLLIHELGHVLGLRHKDSGESVMSTYLASRTSRTEISVIDQENLRCEYN